MIIKITGDPNTGKTTLAKKICEGKKVFTTTESSLHYVYWTQNIDVDTEYILIDDVSEIDFVSMIFEDDVLFIKKKGEIPQAIKMPHVILVSNQKHR